MIEQIKSLIESSGFSYAMIVITIISLLYSAYNKIKFICLEKASKMVAEAEQNHELSGKEKFALVLLWIDEELPAIFKSAAFKAIISTLIEYAYNTSREYMEEYIKRKTGKDVSTIIQNANEENNTNAVD